MKQFTWRLITKFLGWEWGWIEVTWTFTMQLGNHFCYRSLRVIKFIEFYHLRRLTWFCVLLSRYSKEIPDAYERLLLDAIEGERRLFIRSDELDAAWSLFTPVLNQLEEKKIIPEYYPYGSRGPVGAHYLAARYNVRWGDVGPEQWYVRDRSV